MKKTAFLLGACVLLMSCNHKPRTVGGNWNGCHPNAGPWDGNGKVYDLDKMDSDLQDPNHLPVCISSKNKDSFRVKSSGGGGNGHRGPFNLYIVAENTADECQVSKVFQFDNSCQSDVKVQILQTVSQNCDFEMYPEFACTSTKMGTQQGADPHIQITP